MIIDIHCHIWTKEWLPKKFVKGLARLLSPILGMSEERVEKEFLPTYWDPTGEKLLQRMNEAGIDKAVVLPLDFGLAIGEPEISIEEQNRAYAQISSKFPDRLIAFASIDPRRPNAPDFLKKSVEEWGLKGLKIHPTAGFYPNEKITYTLLEKAAQYKLPVITHTGPVPPPLRSKYAQPIHLDDVLVDFPELKVNAAHLGFGWWPELVSLAAVNFNLYLDFAGWQPAAAHNFNNFCQILRSVLNGVGPNKLHFGTDGPVFHPLVPDKEFIQMIRGLPQKAPDGIRFTQEEIDAILGGNARKFLGS